MRSHVVACFQGCGRTRTVTVNDGDAFNENVPWLCPVDSQPFEDARSASGEQARLAAEAIIRRAQLRADIEALKTQDGFTNAYIDDDNNPQTPGILKRFWNRIFGS